MKFMNLAEVIHSVKWSFLGRNFESYVEDDNFEDNELTLILPTDAKLFDYFIVVDLAQFSSLGTSQSDELDPVCYQGTSQSDFSSQPLYELSSSRMRGDSGSRIEP